MIDLDVIKLLPKLYEAIQNDFLLPGVLPGGLHCMMNAVRQTRLWCSCWFGCCDCRRHPLTVCYSLVSTIISYRLMSTDVISWDRMRIWCHRGRLLFTQVHQDSHGAADSGHLCVTGYNEVVMLCRLPEWHKINVLALLWGEGGRGEEYDGLYGLPHNDVRILCCKMCSWSHRSRQLALSSRVSVYRVVPKSQIGRQLTQLRNVKRWGKSCVSFDESIK
jgi:hypothetical protein